MNNKTFNAKKISVFFIVFCSLLFFYTIISFNKTNNSNIYYKLNNSEKKSLDFFFRATFDDNFGYVLFGNKPMALCGYNKIHISENHKIKPIYKIAKSIYEAYYPYNRKIKKGWDIWRKHQRFFSSEDFIIKSEPNPWNNDYEFIILINKSLFFNTIDQHKDDFYNVLGKSFDAHKLWNQCKSGKNLLMDLLKGHNGLIGTLLGYGRDNAWNYHERDLLFKKTFPPDSKEEIIKNKCKIVEYSNILKIFCSEDMEILDDFFYTTNPFEDRRSEYIAQLPQLLRLPQFVANPDSEETKCLKEIYTQNRKDIIELYENKDFLKITLERLKGNHLLPNL